MVTTGPLGQCLDEVLVVAAPCGVHGPDLAGPPAETRRAGDEDQPGDGRGRNRDRAAAEVIAGGQPAKKA